MARRPKPWYWEARGEWYVTIRGNRHKLGPDKEEAYDQFYDLMAEKPQPTVAPGASFIAIADMFLEWTKINRSEGTLKWDEERIVPFGETLSIGPISKLRLFHIEEWLNRHDWSPGHQNGVIRAIMRVINWAYDHGYIEKSRSHASLIARSQVGGMRRWNFLSIKRYWIM